MFRYRRHHIVLRYPCSSPIRGVGDPFHEILHVHVPLYLHPIIHRLFPVPFRSHISCLIYSAITATRHNCSYLQVKNILLTIYKYTLLLDLFPNYHRGMYRPRRFCIFHVLICTDHVVVCRIIQYANKNPSATDKVFMRYRSVIYLGRSGQPSRFLCQVRRPTLRDSLSSLNGYSCKTRKRSRRKATTVYSPP